MAMVDHKPDSTSIWVMLKKQPTDRNLQLSCVDWFSCQFILLRCQAMSTCRNIDDFNTLCIKF